jgi:hypothetical protein
MYNIFRFIIINLGARIPEVDHGYRLKLLFITLELIFDMDSWDRRETITLFVGKRGLIIKNNKKHRIWKLKRKFWLSIAEYPWYDKAFKKLAWFVDIEWGKRYKWDESGNRKKHPNGFVMTYSDCEHLDRQKIFIGFAWKPLLKYQTAPLKRTFGISLFNGEEYYR